MLQPARKIILLITLLFSIQAIAQNNNLQFKKLKSGLEYAFVVNKPTSPTPEIGDLVRVHLLSTLNNRIMYNSIMSNKGKPVEYGVQKPSYNGDIIEAIMLMTPGDSMIIRSTAGPVFAGAKQKLPQGVKPTDIVDYYIKLVSLRTKADMQKEMQAKMQKQMQEQMQAQQKLANAQKTKDDAALKAYFKKNNINPIKTATGLYYTITNKTGADKPKVGNEVTMNYTGKLLDGTKFDSNTDSTFQHVTPYNFKLGQRQVIAGWDEGIALLSKGEKATLYIPSTMAYGTQARPGSAANAKGIPANSNLIFDVEVVDFKELPNEDALLTEYFKKNNLTPTKTPSGMYYTVTQEGTGPKIKPGDKLTMNYTGKFLDGSKFDSNVDSAFQHVVPFKFDVAKGMVIRGWDEGVQLLNKGAKATFYIPSALGYGQQAMPGSAANPKGIPAYSTLVFDVDVQDVEMPSTPVPAPTPKPVETEKK